MGLRMKIAQLEDTIARLTKERDEARAKLFQDEKAMEIIHRASARITKMDDLAAELAKVREAAQKQGVIDGNQITSLAAELAKAREALTEIVNLDQHPVILGGGRKEMGPFAHIARAALPATPEPQS